MVSFFLMPPMENLMQPMASADERQQIIDFIYKHQIKNVIFLTGDVHFSEISVLKADGKPTIYDLTFSTMAAGANTRGESWKNTFRITRNSCNHTEFWYDPVHWSWKSQEN